MQDVDTAAEVAAEIEAPVEAPEVTEAPAEVAAEVAPEAPAEPAADPAPPEVEAASVVLTGHDLIDTLDKDGLEAYARAEFGRELDKRKKLTNLRAEVKALFDGTTQKAEAAEAADVARVEARAASTPIGARHKKLKDRRTGKYFEFDWNPLFEGNADLEPIYAD